jgi:hypothetical protein
MSSGFLRRRVHTTGRLAALVAALAVLSSCSQFDGTQVCQIADDFSLGTSATASYSEVSALTEQLAVQLSTATRSMRDSALKEEARYAAFLARGVTRAIDARQHPQIVEEEIEALVDSILLVRYYCREPIFGGR